MTNNPWDLRIDGDCIVYSAGYASDAGWKKQCISYMWPDSHTPVENSLFNAKLMLNAIIEKFMPCNVSIYLSNSDPSVNFRSRIYTQYKANRKETPKPQNYKELRKYLIDKYKATVVTFGEADDSLGICTTERTVIASADKDLLMIPAWHWRIRQEKGIRVDDPGTLELTEKKDSKGRVKRDLFGTGLKWFIAQLLLGDKIDNIMKPKKGFGSVAVFNFLKKYKTVSEMFRAAANFYEENGKSLGDFLVNCKLLWIAREPNQIFTEDMFLQILDKGGVFA